jgi:glycine/D-amino acid oxidase-like deaminating enzyme
VDEKTAVIGAGIIGICCALELKRKGFDVTLSDDNRDAVELHRKLLAETNVGNLFRGRDWRKLYRTEEA